MARVAIAYVEVRPDLSGFAGKLHAELAKVHATKDVELRVDTKQLNDSISKISRRTVKPIKQRIEPQIDRGFMDTVAKAFRTFAGQFGGSFIGRLFGAPFKFVASMIESVGKLMGDVLSKAGLALVGFGDKFGKIGEFMFDLGIKMTASAAQMGALIGGSIGLIVALGGVGVAFGGVQLAAGGLLGVIVPLVAAVTALAGELVLLGSAAAGSLLILPGAVLGIGAAFGPLILVMSKFQDMFTKTATAVGPFYKVFEQLKNAIFAVITSNFVKVFSTFATTVLPKVFKGLDLVSQAWNKLFLNLLKVASTPKMLTSLNAALRFGAKLVNLLADAAAKVGPAILGFAAAALPALTNIVTKVSSLIGYFSAWFTAMTKSGAAGTLFSDIAGFIGEILTVVRQLAPLMGIFITTALGPARQFVTVVGQIVTALTAFYSSAEGQAALKDFFTSMNTIVGQLGDLFVTAQPVIMKFGPLIADAMTAALPLTKALLGIFMMLFTTALPGVNKFMKDMGAIMSSPVFVAAIDDLGTAISELFAHLADDDAVVGFIKTLELLVVVLDAAGQMLNKLSRGFGPVVDGLKKLFSGDFKGAWKDFTKEVPPGMDKVRTSTDGARGAVGTLAKDFTTFAKNSGINIDGVTGVLTQLANAQAWQVIMDNSRAAAESIAQIGQTAFDTQQLQGEKALGRLRQKQKPFAKKATKPKIDLSGLSKDWSAGWNTAIDTTVGKIANAAKKAGNKFVSNFIPTIKTMNLMDLIHGGKAYDTGIEIARYLAKGITSGAKNIAKATNVIYRANKKNLDALATDLRIFAKKSASLTAALPATWAKDLKSFTTVGQLDAYFAKAKAGWTDMLAEIVDFKAKVRDALVPDKGLVGVFGYFPTPAEVKQRFDDQLADMRKFTAGIAALQAKGLDPELARQWLAAGVEGAGNMVQGLQDATKGQIDEISKAYQGVNAEADKVAEDQAVKWKGVGQATVEGYIAGITSMQDLVTKTMTKLMTDAAKAANKALQSKSPSRVFDEIGVDTMAGYVQGINSMATDTVGAVSDLFGTVAGVGAPTLTPQIKPGLANTGTLGQVAAAPPPDVNVRVYIGDKELTDIARIVVENADSTRARALLAGRRGG